jgi:xylulokinase
VNYEKELKRLGVLLCINGTGILNRWIKETIAGYSDYADINRYASTITAGSEGLRMLPFGNGAERIFENKLIGAQLLNIDLNLHRKAHIFRAAQEGIAFSFRYGLDIMRESGMHPRVIRAGKANMFLSPVFLEAFTNATGCTVELYNTDGAIGAARGAGIGSGFYSSLKEAFSGMEKLSVIGPEKLLQEQYEEVYRSWLNDLNKFTR